MGYCLLNSFGQLWIVLDSLPTWNKAYALVCLGESPRLFSSAQAPVKRSWLAHGQSSSKAKSTSPGPQFLIGQVSFTPRQRLSGSVVSENRKIRVAVFEPQFWPFSFLSLNGVSHVFLGSTDKTK